MIGRISLRIGDIKRSKMVRTINFYYNNRTVQAVQELKNKPGKKLRMCGTMFAKIVARKLHLQLLGFYRSTCVLNTTTLNV